jgi:hypothetical protein
VNISLYTETCVQLERLKQLKSHVDIVVDPRVVDPRGVDNLFC